MEAFYMHHHVSKDSVGLKQVIICSSPYDTHVTTRVTISHVAALKKALHHQEFNGPNNIMGSKLVSFKSSPIYGE
jgi:hypothetical protein